MAAIADVRSRLEKLRDELIPQFKKKIETGEHWEPTCVVLLEEDEEHEFLYLTFEGVTQRQEVFTEMNDYLEASGAVGCLFVLETEFVPEGSKETLDALYVSLKGWGVKEMMAIPFDTDSDGTVTWRETVGPVTDYDDGFITAFEMRVH